MRLWNRKRVLWAIVCDDPTLGPIIFGTYRTYDKALANRRHDDWLIMPIEQALSRQHDWMQSETRWVEAARQAAMIQDLKVDLAIARSSVAAAYEPLSSSESMDGPLFDVMARVRVALAGIGRVRPKVLATGSPSASEFEIGMTVHDGEALLSVLPERMKL